MSQQILLHQQMVYGLGNKYYMQLKQAKACFFCELAEDVGVEPTPAGLEPAVLP